MTDREAPTSLVPSLEQLAERAVEGDGVAVRQLCERLETPVFRLCLRMLGHPQDAEDAAQEVLVKVVTNLSSFRGESALTTWVHRIAARHTMTFAKSRAEARALDEHAFAAVVEESRRLERPRHASTPEEIAMLKEVRLSCTQGMLLALARDERLAVILVDLLGFEGREAALIVEVPDDTLRKRLERGRSRLVSFLQRQCGLVSDTAACRCEQLMPLRVAKGLTTGGPRSFAALSCGDITPAAAAATSELAEVRSIAKAFHRDGDFRATEALRRRILDALPTLLRSDPAS